MYGYRRADLGLLRLFLPAELHTAFKAINKMELALRDLIARRPTEEFRGVYVESGVNPTRKNVLAPGSIGMYSAGSIYNPAQVIRDDSVRPSTAKIDRLVAGLRDEEYQAVPIGDIKELIGLARPDESASERVWNSLAVAESVAQYAKLAGHTKGYLYVDRERGLEEKRRETQGILKGGEHKSVPNDKLTLFLLRTKAMGKKNEAWWPQIRFPDGRYAFAFAI
jgi:hypothetical protein